MTQHILLHIGMPKAASTSIQAWALNQQETLLDAGIYFPAPTPEGRHQQLIQALMSGDFSWLEDILCEDGSHHTVFLSAEGLTWHLQDFPAANLERFRELLSPYKTGIFLNDREAAAWQQSFYRQLVVNPVNPKFLYGTSKEYEEFCNHPRVQFMIDRAGLLDRAMQAYGAESYTHSFLEEDWSQDLCGLLRVPEMAATLTSFPVKNVGFDSTLTEFCRQVNAMQLPAPLRSATLSLFQSHAQSTIDVLNPEAAADVSQHQLASILHALTTATAPEEKLRNALVEMTANL